MTQTVLRIAACFVLIVLLVPFSLAQEDERYDFDGVADIDPQPADPTDWMTSENWSDSGADPLPPFGPAIPDFGTRVEIQTSTFGVDAPEIGPGDTAEAFGVRIGRFGGEGLLTMTGGTLVTADSCLASPFTCNRRLRVGADDRGADTSANRNPGTFNLSDGTVTTDTLWVGSGSEGSMNMSGGEVNTRGDLSLDWSFDAGSRLTLTGGTVNVGTNLRMYRNSNLDVDGGTMLVSGFAGLGYTAGNVTQTPDVTVNISSGLLAADSFLRVEGSVFLDGGVLRAASFNESLSTGTVEINEGGALQFSTDQESIADVQNLITSGFLTTSSPLGTAGFVIEVVDVDGTDFTQVAFAAGLAGDFDGDGDVDGADFLAWQQGFPGTYDASDLTDWKDGFGMASPSAATTSVPEPGALVLSMLAGMALLGRMRSLHRLASE